MDNLDPSDIVPDRQLRIAGITTGVMPDETPYHTGQPLSGFIDKLNRRFSRSQQMFARQRFTAAERGIADERLAPLEIYSNYASGPAHTFLLTQSLLERITLAQAAQDTELTLEQLLCICLQQTDG